jgi:hypothetical protein
MQHGESVQQQVLTLDRDGRAHGTFTSPLLGTNLIFASVTQDRGTAMDADQVDIVPQATQDTSLNGSSNVRITLDRVSYRADEEAYVDAEVDGAAGDALITLESATGTQSVVAPVHDGRASATIRVTDSMGDLRVGAAFVRDGSIAWSTVPLLLDAPGRPMPGVLIVPDAGMQPAATMNVGMRDVSDVRGTAFVRISRGAPTGSALFSSAPALLAIGLTATQVTAPEGTTWHPWVDSTGEHAQVIVFERRTAPPQNLSLEQADTQAVSWSVLQDDGSTLPVQLPPERGRYTMSVLVVDDDGRVISASLPIVVQ